jgi:RNA polymerase sigma-70 factor (ECF subfamily)
MTEPVNEAARLAAARAGSGEALGQALEGCRGYLLGIAEGELPQDLRAKGGASDLVQQTFLEAHRDFAHFGGSTAEELRAWLRRLLLNNVANFTRAFRATAKRRVGREVPLDGDDSAAPGVSPAADVPSPSVDAMAHEQSEALQRALGRLPEDYRQVLALRHQEHLTFEQIGARLGRTGNAARLLWMRAVERLQHELGGPP